jgi:hypothetical protein
MSSDFVTVETAKDFRDSEIAIGDLVLYPRQMGDTLEMQEGRVLEIKSADRTKSVRPDGWDYQTDSKDAWIEVPYKETKFKISPTRSSRYNRRGVSKNWMTGEETPVKPVWVLNGMNVVKA